MLPGMDLFLFISPQRDNTFRHKNRQLSVQCFRVSPFKNAFSLHLCSLSAFGMRWYISTGEIFIHMCPWKERQGKGLLFTTQEILKKDDKTEEDIFSEGNSCLYENFNCYQNFNAVARKGSQIKPQVNFHHYQGLYTSEKFQTYKEMSILFFRQGEKKEGVGWGDGGVNASKAVSRQASQLQI